jgi:hypothetical protein
MGDNGDSEQLEENMIKTISSLNEIEINKDEYYWLSPWDNIGDFVFSCAFKEQFEERHNGKVNMIFLQKQEIIAKMFGIADYFVVKSENCGNVMEEYEKNGKAKVDNWIKGEILKPHSFYVSIANEKEKRNDRSGYYKEFLSLFRLEQETNNKNPVWYPELSQKLKELIKRMGGYDKVVLLCPDAGYFGWYADRFPWKDYIKKYLDNNYTVICNTNRNTVVNGCFYIKDLTIEDCVALSMHVKTISFRSGLTDLMCFRAKDLEVLYPNIAMFNHYSLNSMFETEFFIKEKVYEINEAERQP